MNQVFAAALVGGVFGTFFGGFTKFLWDRAVPDWMTWRRTRRVERDHQMATVRAPAYLAFSEFRARLREIANTQAANYRYLKTTGEQIYSVHSTAYIVARALAWQVILLERMASYDYADLYERLGLVTQALMTGKPGFQFFRLEQREIGERMLTHLGAEDASCMQYSEFLDRMDQDEPPRWMVSLTKRCSALLEHPDKELDRLQAIDQALTKALLLIDPKERWIPADPQLHPLDAEKIRTRIDAEKIQEPGDYGPPAPPG